MPPVIGSLSLNATRNGRFQALSTCHAARLAAEAGSSAVVGTSPGIALGPAISAGSPNGAS
jgi:hypothetical protein